MDVSPLGDLSAGTISHLVSGTTSTFSYSDVALNSSTLFASPLLSSQVHVARQHASSRLSNMDEGTQATMVGTGSAPVQTHSSHAVELFPLGDRSARTNSHLVLGTMSILSKFDVVLNSHFLVIGSRPFSL